MAARNFFTLINGARTLVAATIASTGAAQAFQIIALAANGYIDPSLLPPGSGPDGKMVEVSEAISAGKLGNLHSDITLKARLADASTQGKEADGFFLENLAIGEFGFMYFDGLITGLTGKTIAARQYLSETPGTMSESPLPIVAASAGKTHQFIGKATGTDEVFFERNEEVLLQTA